MAVAAHNEKGEAIAQTVIVAPVLFALIMAAIQFALIAHAQNVAEAAAQEGTSAARRFKATEADGKAEAISALGSLGPQMLSSRTVTVNRTASMVTVTVAGDALSLVPFLHPRVSETASGPVERYVPPIEAGP